MPISRGNYITYKVLLIDKSPDLYIALKTLVSHPVALHYHSDIATAHKTVHDISPLVILLDIDNDLSFNENLIRVVTSSSNGFSILIVLSHSPSVNQVVQTMQEGAHSYILKSNPPQVIYTEVLNIIHRLKLLIPTNNNSHQPSRICGNSIFIHDLKKFIAKCAPISTSILLLGESGTGKDLVAKTIHNMSPRSKEIFLSVNCAAIPETIIEGELFGTESGSYTGAIKRPGKFELADRGTLFLNEIADMSLQFQAKLLTILEEKRFMRLGGTHYINTNVRIIMATNGNLKELVGQRKFREDLYYRIAILPYTLLPLRKRKEDIGQLAWHLLWKMGYNKKFFTVLALEKIMQHDWPGNVRELKNCIERAAIYSTGNAIDHNCIQFV